MRGRLTTASSPPNRAARAGQASPVGSDRGRRLQPAFLTARVLIADDNVDAAEALGEWLEAMGYEVHTAYDGLAALEMARRVQPDAIMLDIAMPYMNGDEVCRRLREEPWAKSVLIVAVTGFSGQEDRGRAFEAGFDFHFVKPVDPRDI